MKKLIPKLIDIVCFIGGSILFVYNLLEFKTVYGYRDYSNQSIYYPDDTQILAAIGLGLIVLGLLIRSWRKEKK